MERHACAYTKCRNNFKVSVNFEIGMRRTVSVNSHDKGLYRSLWRGLPLTLLNVRQVNERVHSLRPDLDGGILPGQQVMVRCRNSVKVDDFLNSFFIHSIFVQTLSDMCVLLSPVRQGRLSSHAAECG